MLPALLLLLLPLALPVAAPKLKSPLPPLLLALLLLLLLLAMPAAKLNLKSPPLLLSLLLLLAAMDIPLPVPKDQPLPLIPDPGTAASPWTAAVSLPLVPKALRTPPLAHSWGLALSTAAPAGLPLRAPATTDSVAPPVPVSGAEPEGGLPPKKEREVVAAAKPKGFAVPVPSRAGPLPPPNEKPLPLAAPKNGAEAGPLLLPAIDSLPVAAPVGAEGVGSPPLVPNSGALLLAVFENSAGGRPPKANPLAMALAAAAVVPVAGVAARLLSPLLLPKDHALGASVFAWLVASGTSGLEDPLEGVGSAGCGAAASWGCSCITSSAPTHRRTQAVSLIGHPTVTRRHLRVKRHRPFIGVQCARVQDPVKPEMPK